MKTVGSILKEARLERKLSLDQMEQATKIRRKFLEALEADNYSSMPSLAYAKGFVKNYSKFLGLDIERVLAVFRRQNAEISKSSILPKRDIETLNASFFQLTPSRFVWIVISGLLLLFLMYFGLQYKKILAPPILNIESPKNNISVTDKRIDVMGVTDADATVTINGISALVRNDGKFFDRVTLDNGTNTVTVIATSRYGKTNSVIRSVILLP
jgi:cytoskeletal protein RodZ